MEYKYLANSYLDTIEKFEVRYETEDSIHVRADSGFLVRRDKWSFGDSQWFNTWEEGKYFLMNKAQQRLGGVQKENIKRIDRAYSDITAIHDLTNPEEG